MTFSRILLALASGIACVPVAHVAAQTTTTFEAIDAYARAKMRSARIPGLALGIVQGDRVVYLQGYGRADQSGRAVTPQTPFLIGSITKSFTALAIMQLVEAGRIELDAPVQRYISWFRVADPDASARITVRQLLTMTSGLPQLFDTQLRTEEDDGALERVVRRLSSVEMTGPVGGAFNYSNSNYETLGLIVQMVSGLSYEDYVKQHIFAPLDMRNSFVSQADAMRHGMASGYRWWFGLPIPAALPYHRAELPAGYVIASAEDMMHFLIAEMNAGVYQGASVLSPAAMATRQTPTASNAYGFGWEFVRINGRTWIGHDGGTANFQTSIFFDPVARVGVYVAANVVNALDTFASPHGASGLDGVTVRAMAQTVLSMATHQPLPDQGIGHERLTLLFNLVIAALTLALVVALARMPRRLTRLTERGISSSRALARRLGVIAIVNFTVPIAVLYLSLAVPAWTVIVTFQPDLGYWLDAIALVLFAKGLVESASACAVLVRVRRADRGSPVVTPLEHAAGARR